MAHLRDADRSHAEQILSYRFAQPELLDEALTHASVAEHRLRSNERMEFLGDAIMGAVVCEYLFRNYPQYLEGELTKIKSAVVSRRVCAQISDGLGLTGLLSLGKGMSGRSQLPSSLAAAVFESTVAAIYLDGGFEPAKRFVLEHMTPEIKAAAESAHQENFKSVLQQHAQKSLEALPTYRLLCERGPDHSKVFEVCVEIAGHRYPAASGRSKKEAEQQAALLALKEMNLLTENEQGGVVFSDRQSEPPEPPEPGLSESEPTPNREL